MRSIVQFLKYNNIAVIIFLVIVFGAVSVFAANPKLREGAIASLGGGKAEQPKTKEVDTKAVRSFNPDAFRFDLKIDSLKDTGTEYQVIYSYQTLDIVDGKWGVVPKKKTMNIPKQMIIGRDFGEYVADQLGQIVAQESRYLAEVKEKMNKKEAEGKDVSGKYRSLVGSEFDEKKKTFEGYIPEKKVIPQEESVTKESEENSKMDATVAAVTASTNASGGIDPLVTKQEIRNMVFAAVAEYLEIETEKSIESIANESENEETPPVSVETLEEKEIVPETDSSVETEIKEEIPIE